MFSDPIVALKKGILSFACHPICKIVYFSHLLNRFHSFISTLSFISIPGSYVQASPLHRWKGAMDE
jgi:hypothetical protein